MTTECDVELLSKGSTGIINYTTYQPENWNEYTSGINWSDWHVHRIDLLAGGRVNFYLDGHLVDQKTTPVGSAQWIMVST